ncbi:MAG: hypothetical protein HY775_13200, partial [Acidobacteria bacterium]|nr:hypothetical protein [Acidobacteriota bacterium]
MGQGTKPARWWIAVTFVFGAAGALTSVGLYSAKTYSIQPLRVELSAMPALAGASQLTVRPRPGIQTGYAEAPTHTSPITLRMT